MLRQVQPSDATPDRFRTLRLFSRLMFGLGGVVLALAVTSGVTAASPRQPPPASPPGQAADSRQRPAAATAPARAPQPAAGAREKPPRANESGWFVILNSPQDVDALWQKLEHPDLVLLKPGLAAVRSELATPGGKRAQSIRAVVESVRVAGQVLEESAQLRVELTVAITGSEAVWVPVRLDDRNLIGAREGRRELFVRRAERSWEVHLAGDGEHRIELELNVPLSSGPERKSLGLAIPEAASTSLDLTFSASSSDIAVGSDRNFPLQEPAQGAGKHLAAYLSPRASGLELD